MNTTRPSDKSSQRAKSQRDAARRSLEWQKREEAKRRKAAKNGPTTPPVRRSGGSSADPTSGAPASA
jgi:hypothetical protein